jgi:hypothetical protein
VPRAATPEHRVGTDAEFLARNINLDTVVTAGNIARLDAAEMLATFMVDGMPDADLFFSRTTREIGSLLTGRKDCTIRVYGEMVDVLWKNGQHAAAIRLEMFWNKLATTHDFALLCMPWAFL